MVEELCEEQCTAVWWCKVCQEVEELEQEVLPPPPGEVARSWPRVLPQSDVIRGGILISLPK